MPVSQQIRLTKLEQKMYKILNSMEIPEALFAQYSVHLPGESQPFSLDFAYPRIGIGIESDGKPFHEQEDFKQRDLQRDQKLAKVGWRILRFREDAIEDQPDMVRDIIYENVKRAQESLKKASREEKFVKYALTQNQLNKNSVYDFMIQNNKKIGCSRKIVSDSAQILFIGEINGD